jgi:hypothetical protein
MVFQPMILMKKRMTEALAHVRERIRRRFEA